jgi:DNA modification methylase
MPKPPIELQSTTLWSYPSQHYKEGVHGNADYKGATPSWVIWNLLQRYTKEGQVVVDPMCGSGTTLDVCRDLDRQGIGFDLQPHHPEVQEGDARKLPLQADSADFLFVDPPYGKNLRYSGQKKCIGELDARNTAYFEAMGKVFEEGWRVLKPGAFGAVYACDIWKRGAFVGLGSQFFFMLSQIFNVVDHIAVIRGNKDLVDPRYRQAAEDTNFFLRGFNHLVVFQKEPELK